MGKRSGYTEPSLCPYPQGNVLDREGEKEGEEREREKRNRERRRRRKTMSNANPQAKFREKVDEEKNKCITVVLHHLLLSVHRHGKSSLLPVYCSCDPLSLLITIHLFSIPHSSSLHFLSPFATPHTHSLFSFVISLTVL